MTPQRPLFDPLPGRRLSWKALTLSVALHGFLLALLLCLPLALSTQAPYRIIPVRAALLLPDFVHPPPARPEPQVIRSPLNIEAPNIPEPAPAPVKPEAPALQRAVEDPPEAGEPPPSKPPRKAAVTALSGLTEPQPEQVDVSPVIRRTPRSVLIGGFEDHAEAPDPKSGRAGGTIIGGFDAGFEADPRPSGGRAGREIVLGSGFGNSSAPASKRPGGNEGSVREGTFGHYLPAAPRGRTREKPAGPAEEAVEIISKPRPVYTREARELGLEGDVILEVLFTAEGGVRILRLVRGLGHGLDEAAMRAAEQIRFKPAESRGQAVDSRSFVQIIFRLT